MFTSRASIMWAKPPKRSVEHVAVILGGWSAEREVSLASGNPCADALESEGYRVTRIDATHDLAQQVKEAAPDVVFNALHGRWGEDGCVQGIMECLQIPYTHSGVLASALAMNKEAAKVVMKAAGIPVAESIVVTRREALERHVMEPPYVLKPICEGSSVGVLIVREGSNRPPQALLEGGHTADELVMAERFVAGRELTCAVVGDQVTDIIDIVPRQDLSFYDYEAKYAPGGSVHVLPAKLSPDIYQSVRRLTLSAHKALGCRGVSRADFRYDDTPGGTGALVCLEVNTQPGMTATSLVPELAGYAGWTFPELVRWMVEDASCNR